MIGTSSIPSGHVWHGGRMITYRIEDRRDDGVRPPVLVVVPYYNAEPWIGECLSRLAANDEPHDILIVDDGSEVPFTCPAGVDNVAVCRFSRNAGLITALNFAADFALANGYTYYVRQDADDFSSPRRLRLQREAIERDQADMVVSGVHAVDETGATIWRARMSEDIEAFRRTLTARNPTVHSTWFLRSDVFVRIGCYDERFKGAEDFELLQRIARQGRIAFVPDELVEYQVRSGSILSGSRQPALQTLRIVARHFDPARPASYTGVARAAMAAIVSRRTKTIVRKLFRRKGA